MEETEKLYVEKKKKQFNMGQRGFNGGAVAIWGVSENLLVTAAVAMHVQRILGFLTSSGMSCPITLETPETETIGTSGQGFQN